MDHNKIKEDLFTFNDQDFPEHERQEILMHLEICTECNHELKAWNSANRILSKLSEPEYSTSFVNSVMKRLPDSDKKGFLSFLKFNQWLIPAAATALILLFCIPLLSKQTTINTENLLLAELPDDTDNWAFSSNENPDINILFGISQEEL